MRATKAYIASAGTAAVMLGASICVLALVSGFIAFGSWPGEAAHARIDSLVLREVQDAKPALVAVSANAVVVAQRNAQGAARAGGPGAQGRRRAPGVGSPTGGTRPAGQAPGGNPLRSPAAAVTGAPPVSDVGKSVDTTSNQVTKTVQQHVQAVTKQVDAVIHGATGAPPPPVQAPAAPAPPPVQVPAAPAAPPVVTNTTSSLLGH
jgi:hypothetical protein